MRSIEKTDLSTLSTVLEPGTVVRRRVTTAYSFPTPQGRQGSYFFHCRKSKQKV
ncbi:MAG: hypothetical protein IPN79_00550 [Saprospiraceae bacterium]|nr:hypothetical protein [Saprospiraceae bacterium]